MKYLAYFISKNQGAISSGLAALLIIVGGFLVFNYFSTPQNQGSRAATVINSNLGWGVNKFTDGDVTCYTLFSSGISCVKTEEGDNEEGDK